jgi:hypothetical protein
MPDVKIRRDGETASISEGCLPCALGWGSVVSDGPVNGVGVTSSGRKGRGTKQLLNISAACPVLPPLVTNPLPGSYEGSRLESAPLSTALPGCLPLWLQGFHSMGQEMTQGRQNAHSQARQSFGRCNRPSDCSQSQISSR